MCEQGFIGSVWARDHISWKPDDLHVKNPVLISAYLMQILGGISGNNLK